MYLFLGVELTEGLRATGKVAEANAVSAMTRKVAQATDQDPTASQSVRRARAGIDGRLGAGACRLRLDANDASRRCRAPIPPRESRVRDVRRRSYGLR